MSKPNGNGLPKVWGFYQPHSRAGDYTGEVVHPITGEVSIPPTMTKQEFRDECDINNIVKEFLMTGNIATLRQKAAAGVFADLPEGLDFQEGLHVVMRGERAFAELPARVRDRFHNDPQEFLDFCSNPANLPELRELGLAKPAETPPIAPPAPPPADPPQNG